VVVGTGRLTLDAIVAEGAPVRRQAGGTCGNVLANLAYLGWHAYPVTRLGDDPAGRQFAHDLARWGARLDLVRVDPTQRSPVIVHHIRRGPGGAAVHSFSSRCPFCGARLPGYRPLPARAVREVLPRLPAPQAVFFDRDSRGALLLARAAADRGALVVFEPNYLADAPVFDEALAAAHVLKFSRQRLPDLAQSRPLRGPLLVVETLGADGLRYRDQRPGAPASWQHLDALPVRPVLDAAGCGDWCTAGLIHGLGPNGRAGLEQASAQRVREALRFGQALAALNCAFEGARGPVYHCDRPSFERAVLHVLSGAGGPLPPCAPPTLSDDPPGSFCPHCPGEPGAGYPSQTKAPL
jgi:fructokinase